MAQPSAASQAPADVIIRIAALGCAGFDDPSYCARVLAAGIGRVCRAWARWTSAAILRGYISVESKADVVSGASAVGAASRSSEPVVSVACRPRAARGWGSPGAESAVADMLRAARCSAVVALHVEGVLAVCLDLGTMSSLSRLSLAGCALSGQDFAATILSNDGLSLLSLSGITWMGKLDALEMVLEASGHCANVQRLDVAEWGKDEDILGVIGAHCPLLRVLDVRSSKDVCFSVESIAKLNRGCPLLQCVRMNSGQVNQLPFRIAEEYPSVIWDLYDAIMDGMTPMNMVRVFVQNIS
ncbi:hypothetical protein HK405_011305 [Cladochytrium tenue]|nr:hypothetical protein HK405_011305 [Cladochytrium tenue]